jgi:hypothetical protein
MGGYPGYGAAAAPPAAARAAPQFKIFNPKAVAATGAPAAPAPVMAAAPPSYPPTHAYDTPAQEEEVNLSASSSNVFQ